MTYYVTADGREMMEQEHGSKSMDHIELGTQDQGMEYYIILC